MPNDAKRLKMTETVAYIKKRCILVPKPKVVCALEGLSILLGIKVNMKGSLVALRCQQRALYQA